MVREKVATPSEDGDEARCFASFPLTASDFQRFATKHGVSIDRVILDARIGAYELEFHLQAVGGDIDITLTRE